MATERIDVVVTETGTREVSRRIEDVGRAATQASGPLLAMQRLLASYVSFEGIRRLMQLADQYTEMENRIRVLDGATQHYSVTLRRLYDISQDTRSSLRDNVLLFQRMGLAQRELGATTEELFQVTKAVGQAIAIQGGLATTSAGAVLQLSQAFGSGRVQLEEFNSVITGLYPIAKAAAEGIDGTGGSIARLRRMIADGEVDSGMLFRGILNSLESLDEQFKQTVPTISQAFTTLRNAMVMYIGELNTASGASESFARSIIALSKNLDEVVKGAVVAGAALGPYALTRIILGLRTAFVALNAAILANPFGAMATAASAAITYLLVFNKELDDLAKSIDENATVVDRLGAVWAGVLAYIKKSWETFPEWFGGLMTEAVDKGIESLSKFGTRLFGDLEADVAQGEKILGFFGIKLPAYIEKAKEGLPGFKDELEGALNFDLPPGVLDRQKESGSQAAQAFSDAYEDYLLRARARREELSGGGSGGGGGVPPGSDLKALEKLRKELDKVLDAIDPVEAAWRKFFSSLGTLDKGLEAGILSLEEYEVAVGKLKSSMQDSLFPFEATMRGLQDQIVLLSHEAKKRERLAQIYDVEKELKRALTEEELQLLDARLEAVQVAEREAQLMDEIQQPTLDHIRNIQALNNLYQDGAISASEFNQKLQELRYQFLQTQTDFGSGVERGLIKIEQDFTDVASVVENAMVNAFRGMEDALTQFLRTGKLDVKNFVNGVLDDLARLYVRQNVTAPLARSLGLGGQQAQQGSSFGMPSFSTGTGGMSNMIYGAGEKMGSYALQNFAAGMSGYMPSMVSSGLGASLGAGSAGMLGTSTSAISNTTFSASLSGGGSASSLGSAGAAFGKALPFIGAGLQFASGDKWGGGGTALGATIGSIVPGIGTALGGIVGSVAGSVLGGIFGGREPTTRRMQRVTSEYGDGEFGITSRDGRQAAGTEDLVRQLAESAVQSTNDLFERVGVAASVNSLFAITESSYKGDRQGVASGGTLSVGDQILSFGLQELYGRTDMTQSGFGGWSSAEMLPRLQTDLQLSMMSAFQAAGDQLPNVLSGMLDGIDIRSLGAEQAAALAATFQGVIDGVTGFQAAVEMLPFANLRDLSFDAAANLIHFAGGLENLDAGMTTYFQNFYSEAEQLDWLSQQLGTAFESIGMTMPDVTAGADAAKQAFREMVEAQDINTEGGQKATAMLYTISGSFAELVEGLEGLNPAVEEVVEAVDYLGLAVEAFTRHAAGAERALQLSLSGGQLADRIGGMLGLSPVFAMRREQELWATIGQGSYEQQISMSQELTELVLSRINAEQQANQQRLTTLRQELTTYRSLQSIGASLQNYLTSLESSALAPYTLGEKVGNAEAELARLVQAARGGDDTAMRQVQGALQNALTLWRDYGASGMQYQDAYHRLTGMVGDLAGQAVSEAEAQLMQLELQAESLESISGISETSLAQLRDLYTLTAAATDAAHEQYWLEIDAAAAQLSALEKMSADTEVLHDIAGLLGGIPAQIGAQISGVLAYDQRYLEDKLAQLQATGSMHGGIDWSQSTPDDLIEYFRSLGLTAQSHYWKYGQDEGLSYGVHGSHASGLWEVPFDGYRAELHAGERVLTAAQTRAMDAVLLSGAASGGGFAALAGEIRALKQEVAQLRQQNERLSRDQVTAVIESSRENAKQITTGVGGSIERRERMDINARNAKRVGVLA